MSNELKDCPFCGREPEQSERADNNTSTGRAYFIACMCGGYSANAHQFGETKEEVTSKWNCRPIAPVASAAPSGELPPLPDVPEHGDLGYSSSDNGSLKTVKQHYSAHQVREFAEAYARAIIAATAPNKQLVAALQEISTNLKYHPCYMAGAGEYEIQNAGGDDAFITDQANIADAALASAGVEVAK